MPEIKRRLWQIMTGLIVLAFFFLIEYESRVAIQLRINQSIDELRYKQLGLAEEIRLNALTTSGLVNKPAWKDEIMPSCLKGKKRVK